MVVSRILTFTFSLCCSISSYSFSTLSLVAMNSCHYTLSLMSNSFLSVTEGSIILSSSLSVSDHSKFSRSAFRRASISAASASEIFKQAILIFAAQNKNGRGANLLSTPKFKQRRCQYSQYRRNIFDISIWTVRISSCTCKNRHKWNRADFITYGGNLIEKLDQEMGLVCSR